MIILIGGSSHVGKTLLAQKLLEELKYPYISLDHLKMGFIRNNMTSLTVENDYEMRYFLWPYASEIIKTAVENKQNLILEGCYIPKEWKESFTEEYLCEIKAMFLVMSEEYLRNNFDSVCAQASVIESRIDDEPDLERLIACSREFKQIAAYSDSCCIEINEKYDIDDILKQAVSIVGKAK